MDIPSLIRKHKILILGCGDIKNLSREEQILVNLFPDIKDVVLKTDNNISYYFHNCNLLFKIDKHYVYLNKEFEQIDYEDVCIWISYYFDVDLMIDYRNENKNSAISKYITDLEIMKIRCLNY